MEVTENPIFKRCAKAVGNYKAKRRGVGRGWEGGKYEPRRGSEGGVWGWGPVGTIQPITWFFDFCEVF